MDEINSSPAGEPVFSKGLAVKTILGGGLVVGLLDALFAFVFYDFYLGVGMGRIFQSIAAGLLGKSAYEGGAPTVLLGIALHFVVASCITAVYFTASRWLPVLIRRSVVCGLIYGLLAYLGMNYVVIPLSRGASGNFSWLVFTVATLAHAVLVGLPAALITRHFAKTASVDPNFGF